MTQTLPSARSLRHPSSAFRALRGPAALAAAAFVLAACGGGDSGSASIALSGTVSALTTEGLILSDDGKTVSVPANTTSFSFGDVSGSYAVTILSQPAGQTCSVTNGTGVTNGSSVTNVAVNCRAYAVYVADGGSNAIGEFSVASDGTLTPAPGAAFVTPFSPGSIVLSPDGLHAWVAYQDVSALSDLAIDASGALSLVGSASVAVGAQDALALGPDGRTLYAAEFSDASVSQFSIDADGLLGSAPATTVTAGVNPSAIAAISAGTHTYVYAANTSSNSISGYGLNGSGKLVALSPAATSTLSLGTSPRGLAANSTTGYVYVTLADSAKILAYAVDPATGALTLHTSQSTGATPRGLALTPSGGFAYVANFGSNTISQYALAGGALTLLSTPTVAAGSHPVAIAVSPDGTHAYAANFGDNTVSEYSIGASGALTLLGSASSAGAAPTAIAVR